jgi:hypothetical protein
VGRGDDDGGRNEDGGRWELQLQKMVADDCEIGVNENFVDVRIREKNDRIQFDGTGELRQIVNVLKQFHIVKKLLRVRMTKGCRRRHVNKSAEHGS